MTDVDPPPSESSGVAESTYALLRSRLAAAAGTLSARADALNQRRLETYGSSTLDLLATERVRSDANAVPRDVVTVGNQLIVGYNVAAGIRAEVRAEDVFVVYHLERDAASGVPVFSPNPEGLEDSALDDDQFHRDFDELHTYFKDTRLQQLYRTGSRLLAVFRTGGGVNDLRVLRWEIDPDNQLRYLDARGDRDHRYPPNQDVEWTLTTRADHIGANHVAIDERVVVNPIGGTLDLLLDDGGHLEDGGAGSLLLSDRLQHADQSLQDCQISWARAGELILLDVLPYGETDHRFYLINLLVHRATRLDALGEAFRQLPDSQGLIFPEGVYLKTGELRTFDLDVAGMQLLEVVRSPNGEDVLYVFHEQQSGRSILLPYNVVRQAVAAPIWCHGHTLFDDGMMVVFREEDAPTRIHPIQVWATPFGTDEWFATQPQETSEFDRIGNPALVSGIADALALARLVEDVEPSTEVYADLLSSAGRFVDAHHWLGEEVAGDLVTPASDIRLVAEQVIDEFERLQQVQAAAADALAEAEADTAGVLTEIKLSPPTTTEGFIDNLADLRRTIGHLHTTRERREIDTARIDELVAEAEAAHADLAQNAAAHLATPDAFAPYLAQLSELAAAADGADSSVLATRLLEEVDGVAASMDLVASTISDLVVDDPRVRTSVLEQVSGVLAELNRVRATAVGRREALIQSETGAAFSTELGLFGQSIATAIGRADTPEACDDAVARLLLQLEQIETAGPRTDAQIDELAQRRDQVTEALSTRRQSLVDAGQQKAERLVAAAERTLQRVVERSGSLASADDINGFFAADAMVSRVRTLVEDLRELGEPVRADELASRLGASRDSATRALRDRQDLYDGDAVKLGRFRFSVDDRARELTLVPGEAHLEAVLTGTDLRLPVHDEALDSHQDLWSQPLASETPAIYRSTYLASDLLLRLLEGDTDAGAATDLRDVLLAPVSEARAERLLAIVRRDVDHRLDEGYDRGVHDLDAAAILGVIGPIALRAGTLAYTPTVRGRAQRTWAYGLDHGARDQWVLRGSAAAALTLDPSVAAGFESELATLTGDTQTARYLLAELTRPNGFGFARTRQAEEATAQLAAAPAVRDRLDEFSTDPDAAVVMLSDFATRELSPSDSPLQPEIVAAVLTPDLARYRVDDVDLSFSVNNLVGRHETIIDAVLSGRVDTLLALISEHRNSRVPEHRDFVRARREALADVRAVLRVDEVEPQVPEGFVRNQLIDEVYLPLIGDNLARQIGTVDDQAGSRSGMLMLLSPPGYGKTLLVEYLADRLGMALVKVSGPGLGHDVTSLDPAQAPNATAARELERINLSFAMASNVMLYLDDIQHTNPEFLQRFIALCDAQRQVEGVWNGASTSFDLRGKRFAVVMAGNPYTESGERFQIPDMLANRADTYNLGDVLSGSSGGAGADDMPESGNAALFARSYLENALSANPVLAPLAGADRADLDLFLAAAAGDPLDETSLQMNVSSVEANEMVSILRHLRQVQEVVLSVNRQYIASAATADEYRTEPPFLLQGSYRNMARLASKLVPAMTPAEVDVLLDEHYTAESQALTGAAEANLLKLAELRGKLSEPQRKRWDEIRATFGRRQRLGGDDTDPTTRVVAAIDRLADAVTIPTSTGSGERERPV